MRLTRITAENYRNLAPLDFSPAPEVNILWGNNGQGKTNILEAIWLFTGGRSFRGARDAETVAFTQAHASIYLEFEARQRSQTAQIGILNKRRSVILNKKKQRSSVSLVGQFCAVVFSPVHLSLIKDGPGLRRNFLDAAICQNNPGYATLLMRYNHILAQRNALLKSLQKESSAIDTLSIWDDELCRNGEEIVDARLSYLKKLNKRAVQIYEGISDKKETLSIEYECLYKRENEFLLQEELNKNRRRDIALGFTTAGVHRDDLSILISDVEARLFASQGQQRSAVLAMKLAEAEVLEETLGEPPVILLDDVMSELDRRRQEYLKSQISGRQVFITCCESVDLADGDGSKKIHVQDGKIHV